jgi:hypothetical protein
MVRGLIAIAAAAMLVIPETARAQAAQTGPIRAADAGAAVTSLLYSGTNLAGPIDDFGVVQALRAFISEQISTFPIATSWSGMSLRLAPDGSVTRVPNTLGPLFAERPQTAGRGHWSMGVTVQPVHWNSIDRTDLRNDGIAFQQQSGSSLETWRARMSISSLTLVSGVTVGLTKGLDLGMSLPYSVVRINGTSSRDIVSSAGRVLESIGPNEISGESQGIGDLSLRAKYQIADGARGGDWAVSAEWRLPTGDADQLLGTGRQRFRATLIGGTTTGPVSAHMNIGYVWAGSGITISRPDQPADKKNPILFGPLPETWLRPDLYIQLFAKIDVQPSDEINYTSGLDVAVSDRITVDADLIGRVVRNSASLVNIPFQTPLGQFSSQSQPFLVSGTANRVFGIIGAKFALGKTVFTAHALIPGSRSGLTAAPTLLVGLERAVFGRGRDCGRGPGGC